MLVLSRKVGEKIVIGSGADAVVVTLTEIDHNKVKLGFEGPKDTPIFRKELADAGAVESLATRSDDR